MKRPMMEPMITKAEALDRLFARWNPKQKTETVPLHEAAGRVLAEDRYAQYDLPVVRASSMDGVAIAYASVEHGVPDTTAWRVGKEFVRADTGDDFDDAYDTVIAIEDVTLHPEGGLSFAPDLEITTGKNVRPRGSKMEAGAPLVRAGTVLTALDLAVLGTGGWGDVPVVCRPRVAFLPTGSELVPVGSPLERGQHFDTNSLMAAQLLREMGAEPFLFPILRDDPAELELALDEALERADIVLINAGTSKGGEDHCAPLLDRQGERLFHWVAAVPGRPISMAVKRGKPVVNLSGPALACFYSMDWAVRPMVCRGLGIPVPQRPEVTATLTAPMSFSPVLSMLRMLRLAPRPDGSWDATPMTGSPSPTFAETLTADALYISTPGEAPKEKGTSIPVELLRPLP